MKNRRLDSIIAGYILRIPDYQRGYAWGEKQWKEFVEDIDALIDEQVNSHYTGTIVLYVPRDKQNIELRQYGIDKYPVAEIIDGQQRLTTISLYLAAIIHRLLDLGNDAYKDALSQYIYKSGQCKMLLNNNTEHLYYELVTSGCTKSTPTTTHQQRLKNAYDFLSKHIKDLQQQRLIDLYSAITTKLHFSSYIIDDPSEVGMTFELMNSRGKDLTDLELLKNYLMYWTYRNASDEDKGTLITEINTTWRDIYQNLQDENEEFQCLRIAWILLCTYVPKEWSGYDGFKRNNIIPIRDFTKKDRSEVVNFIKTFNDVLSLISFYYSQITRQDQQTKEQTKWLSKIKRAGNVANFIPLIVVAKIKLEKGVITESDYIQLLKSIETYSYRVFIWQGKRSNAGLTNFFKWSYELYADKNTITSIIESIFRLCSYYSSETDFIEECYKLTPWYIESKRALKYTLYEYELHLLEVEGKGVEPKLQWKALEDSTLEHILPQTPENNSMWLQKWSEADREKYTHDISNIVLTLDNSHYSNFEFSRKRGTAGVGHCYANADIRQERKIADYSDWTQVECDNRKQILSEWICSRWGIKSSSANNVKIEINDEE